MVGIVIYLVLVVMLSVYACLVNLSLIAAVTLVHLAVKNTTGLVLSIFHVVTCVNVHISQIII